MPRWGQLTLTEPPQFTTDQEIRDSIFLWALKAPTVRWLAERARAESSPRARNGRLRPEDTTAVEASSGAARFPQAGTRTADERELLEAQPPLQRTLSRSAGHARVVGYSRRAVAAALSLPFLRSVPGR